MIPSFPEFSFGLLFLLAICYLFFDGYDLGIGMLQYFSASEEKRLSLQRSIRPFWNGNEVWLLALGGGIFAFFPVCYATLASAFYIPIILLIMALILRAIFISFHEIFSEKITSFLLFASSFMIAMILGIAAGNILTGIPLNEKGEYIGSVKNLLTAFSLLFGFCIVILCIWYALGRKRYEKTKKKRHLIPPLLLIFLIGMGSMIWLYPYILLASNDAAYSVSIIQGASSNHALKIGSIYLAIGLPLVGGSFYFLFDTFAHGAKQLKTFTDL